MHIALTSLHVKGTDLDTKCNTIDGLSRGIHSRFLKETAKQREIVLSAETATNRNKSGVGGDD
jgi:hypothetical protein